MKILPFKMHSSLIIRVILLLSCVTVIVSATVDGNNVSTGSQASPAPTRKSDSPVNVNQDTRNIEKTIKSLETTLEENFQELIHVVNVTFGRNPTHGSGKTFVIVLLIVVFFNYYFFLVCAA